MKLSFFSKLKGQGIRGKVAKDREAQKEGSGKVSVQTSAVTKETSSANVVAADTSQDNTFEKYATKKRSFPIGKLLLPLVVVLLGGLIYVGYQLAGKGGIIDTKRGELTWWGIDYDEDVINPLIEEYQKQHPNVKITYIKQSPKDYRDRLRNSMVQEKAPDIFSFHNSWVPMFSADLSTIPNSVMSVDEYAKTFYPIIVSNLSSGSGFVGIPLEYDALTLYVNEDIFAQAARTPPATWDEFSDLAIELTSKEQQRRIIQSGAALGLTENVDHWPEILALMMLQNDVDLSNPTGKLAVDAITYYTSFSFRDKLWDDTLPRSTIAFAQGKVAMYVAPSWRANEIKDFNPNLRFRTVPLPQLRRDDPNAPDTSYATYWAEGVWNKSANTDLAWDFLKFMSQKETLQEMNAAIDKKGNLRKIYPRIDMSDQLINDDILGSVVALAPDAKSWYLASDTNDGETGLNTQLAEIFAEVIAAGNTRNQQIEPSLKTATKGIGNVLSQYQVSR